MRRMGGQLTGWGKGGRERGGASVTRGGMVSGERSTGLFEGWLLDRGTALAAKATRGGDGPSALLAPPHAHELVQQDVMD